MPRSRWVRRAIGVVARWLSVPVSLLLLGAAIASFWGQMRVFSRYGPSIAVDRGVMVVECEYPDRRGNRFVGSDNERQWNPGGTVVFAWNKDPWSDSALRRSVARWWVPLGGAYPCSGGVTIYWVAMPVLLPWAVAMVYSWRSWSEWWRRRRRGMCRSCGYDLAGLATAAVCPECGRKIVMV